MKNINIKIILLSGFSILFGLVLNELLNLDKLVYNSLSEQFTSKQIEQYFDFQEKWQWLGYFFVSLLLLIKSTLIASVIYVGAFFFSKIAITFKNIWNCVIQAEFIFLIVPILKIAWFYFFHTKYTLEDIQYFYPLSALNITGYQGLDPWLIYPLQVLNLFELAYIIYLSYQIGQLTQTNTDNGLKIVAYSYVPALFLWVTVVMFFTLNYS
jgi:hypothetical protein